MGIEEICLLEFPSKRWPISGYHSLLKQTGARKER